MLIPFSISHRMDSLRLVEKAKTGSAWEIVVIEEGFSKNQDPGGRQYFYPKETLAAAVPVFEGALVYSFEFRGDMHDHLPDENIREQGKGLVKNLIGRLSNARYQSLSDGKKAIVARLDVYDDADWLRKKFMNVFGERKPVLGFSIDAQGEGIEAAIDGVPARKVTAINKVDSVDVVTYPAAGGRLLRIVASQGEQSAMNPALLMLQRIREGFPSGWLEGFDISSVQGDAASGMLTQVLEANRNKYTQGLVGLDPETQKFKEQAKGLAALQQILMLIGEGKMDEAKKLLEEMVAAMTAAEPAQASRPQPPAPPAPAPAPAPVQQQQSGGQPATAVATDPAVTNRVDALEQKLAEQATATALAEALGSSGLPPLAQNRIRKDFQGSTASAVSIQESINDHKDYLASLSDSGAVASSGVKTTVVMGDEDRDRHQKAMDGMLMSNDQEGIPAFVGLHESLRLITGFFGSPDEMANELMYQMCFSLPGRPGDDKMFKTHHRRLRESVAAMPLSLREATSTSTWAELFGDSIRRMLIMEYKNPELPDWTRVVSNIIPLKDFRTNRRIRLGGFVDLDTVAELGTYLDIAVPDDEEVTYGAEKRGNLFPISWEAMLADDLGKVRQIPMMLGRAANRTIAKFTLNTLFTDNPTIFDSNLLISGAHNNNQTAALSEATLQLANQQIRKQTELSSGERIGLSPKLLVVPADLEDTGWELINSTAKVTSAENATVPSVTKAKYGMEVLDNIWQTDTNNWFVIANPKLSPTIEIGFLGGRRVPEIFIQDQPNVGSHLTADKITYKIRFVFGGAVLDFRSFAGSIVP